jgi:phenolic acid decarboxylase
MRRLVYNSPVETEIEFLVLDDANCSRWVQDFSEDFHVDISHAQENIYRVRSTEDFAGSKVSRNFCCHHEVDAARALYVVFTLPW